MTRLFIGQCPFGWVAFVFTGRIIFSRDTRSVLGNIKSHFRLAIGIGSFGDFIGLYNLANMILWIRIYFRIKSFFIVGIEAFFSSLLEYSIFFCDNLFRIFAGDFSIV